MARKTAQRRPTPRRPARKKARTARRKSAPKTKKPKVEWYEEQAAKAPWRGTVNGKQAYLDRFGSQWEICCRMTNDGKGVIMFTLTNKEAIRRLAATVSPPIPESLQKKLMKGAKRDVPVNVPGPSRRKVVFLVAAVLVAAAVAAALLFPG